jgi:hypothetical protein
MAGERVEGRVEMFGFVVGRFATVLVWVLVMPVMGVLLGVPACVYLVGKKSRGGLAAFVGWIVGVRLGVFPTVDGPFGVHPLVFWPGTVVFSVWFVFGFVSMWVGAFRRAWEVRRLMTVYGMPRSEIV